MDNLVEIQSRKQLKLGIQVIYGIGVSYAIVDQIFAQWLLYFYLPPASSQLTPLLPPIFLSLALLIARFLDTILEPIIGFWSDRFQSRWGRRIPFMFLGALPLSLSTIAFFYPVTDQGHLTTFTYLTIVGCLFFIFYTLVSGPYCALLPEIAHNREDQLNLSMWQSIFRLIYTAIAMILPGYLIHTLGGGDEIRGIRAMIILLSSLSFLGIMLTSLTLKEKDFSGGKTSNISLKDSMKIILKDRSYCNYLIGFMFFFLGFNTLRASMNYFVIDVMGFTTGHITLASALLFGSSAACFGPVTKLSKKIGYKKPMLWSLYALIALSLMLFQLGKFLPSWSGFIVFILMGLPVAGAAFIFPPAMVSDVSARYSQEKKLNIEGVLFGFQGIALKFAFLISITVLPILLVWGGDLNLLQSMTVTPDAVSIRGVYATSLFAAMAFAFSAVFYARIDADHTKV